MKSFLTITALLEGITGLGLAIAPSLLVSILLGTSPTDPVPILVGRLAGASLIIIAVLCWLLRSNTQASVLTKVMLGYNIFTILLLGHAAMVERISGPGLWPAVLIHSGLSGWSLSVLQKRVQKVN